MPTALIVVGGLGRDYEFLEQAPSRAEFGYHPGSIHGQANAVEMQFDQTRTDVVTDVVVRPRTDLPGQPQVLFGVSGQMRTS